MSPTGRAEQAASNETGLPSAPHGEERWRLWLGVLLAAAVGVTLSLPAFLLIRRGFDRWTLVGLAVSLSSFLLAYLISSFRHAARVERLVTERTAELESANRRLQELGRLKDEFVANVSHELRTPMSIIREGVSQVREEILGSTTPHQRKSLEIVLRNIDRLGRIIDDLLDISKLESGRMQLHRAPLDLEGVVREAVAPFLSRAQENGLQVKTRFPREPVVAFADRERVIQVLTNLIDNALKFTPKGEVAISIEEIGSTAECRVSDTGKGIPAEDLPKIFDKFQQFGRIIGPGAKGTGLGLAICKKIVELHGGQIHVESAPSRGTTFTFSLPRDEGQEALHAA